MKGQDMDKFVENYYRLLNDRINATRVTDGEGNTLSLEHGVARSCDLILDSTGAGGTVMFIGNGGSSSISSHMAIDFWKNGDMKSTAFNDFAQLTCLGNDCGYEHIFGKPIDMFANKGDVLVAISSSGRSPNIMAGVEAARNKQCSVITMSGFSPDNPLGASGDLNFHVPDGNYGPVEILHQSLCHCILDRIMASQGKIKF